MFLLSRSQKTKQNKKPHTHTNPKNISKPQNIETKRKKESSTNKSIFQRESMRSMNFGFRQTWVWILAPTLTSYMTWENDLHSQDHFLIWSFRAYLLSSVTAVKEDNESTGEGTCNRSPVNDNWYLFLPLAYLATILFSSCYGNKTDLPHYIKKYPAFCELMFTLRLSSAASNFFWISSRERSFFFGGERGNSGTDSFDRGLRISSKAWPEARFSSSFTWISGFYDFYIIFITHSEK